MSPSKERIEVEFMYMREAEAEEEESKNLFQVDVMSIMRYDAFEVVK